MSNARESNQRTIQRSFLDLRNLDAELLGLALGSKTNFTRLGLVCDSYVDGARTLHSAPCRARHVLGEGGTSQEFLGKSYGAC